MADSDSDLETDRFESALDALFVTHCGDQSSPNSKEYCSEFCALVEEHTGRWQVPLPQLKVLRTALCSFTKATAAFPDDCQHMRYALSSLALSYFELMLFFSKEEFVEEPMKDILDSFQECHLRLLRHRNAYFMQVRQTIKAGGPWESPVLQGIMRETSLTQTEVDEYLSSEVPVFLELRVRYLQACERVQEAMALSKTCLEHHMVGKHRYFHQAYLTCLYKASLHEHLHKEMAELDGRDAVEIICNTESVEKGEVLLSLCKAFLNQQLHNGDMYYIWDLVFIWSRLHLRAHPSRQGFLAECRQMASAATNVRAIFPFIKVLTAELGDEGVQFCVELCAHALQLCDLRADPVTSLVCKTIAFLLPDDLEVCRACALLVFCQERSLEAYRTVCLLYRHPDEELHPCNSPVPTNVRFHMLQILKEGLCFDPEFWNLLTLRTRCLELFSDKSLKEAVLSEMEAEEEETVCEEEHTGELCPLHSIHSTQTISLASCRTASEPCTGQLSDSGAAQVKRRKWRRRRKRTASDDEADFGDDPEYKFYVKPSFKADDSQYSLRRKISAPSVKLPPNRQREYLSRCVKNNILKRKGRKKRWLQGLPVSESAQGLTETKVKVKVKVKATVKGKKRKTSQRLELSYPENEVSLEEEDSGIVDEMDTEGGGGHGESQKENELEINNALGDVTHENVEELEEKRLGVDESSLGEHANKSVSHTEVSVTVCEGHPPSEPELPAHTAESGPELGEPAFELLGCPIELFHNYSLNFKTPDDGTLQPSQSTEEGEHTQNGDRQLEENPLVEARRKGLHSQVKVKKTWKEKMLRSQPYCHLTHHCILCQKDFKGLNVMRHALSHLKKNKLKCILCGKWFRQLPFAKKHIMDHIDTMCKDNDKASKKDMVKPNSKDEDKSGKKKKDKPSGKHRPSGNKSDTKVTPVNGAETVSENLNQDGDENRPSSPSQQQKRKKNSLKTKPSPQLSRESRIIRNLHVSFRKLHKIGGNTDASVSKPGDFADEQVVFSEDVVTVRHLTPVTEQVGAEELKEKRAGENGYSGCCTIYNLCPSEDCDKVFTKLGPTMRHALKYHANEDRVLEKTFLWSKNKCVICQRQMQFLQQYKDHLKLHDNPLRFFCYHMECSMRFSTHQELKDHVEIHKPFKPQCSYTGCQQQFALIQGLYDHEWRHYTRAPQKEEMVIGPNRHKTQSAEAPWKQRVRIEEIWIQGGKGQEPTLKGHYYEEISTSGTLAETDESEPRTDESGLQNCGIKIESEPQGQGTAVTDPGSDQNMLHLATPKSEPETVDISKIKIETTLFNGHVEGKGDQISEGKIAASNDLVKVAPEHTITKPGLEIKESEGTVVFEGLEERQSAKLKTFKPEDPTNTFFGKTPLIRPPPSAYMNEKELSMRKRRSVEDDPPKRKVIPYKYKKLPVKKEEEEIPEVKTRSRCNKCLSFFNSVEEMNKHQALNTCSALFGFDSDDES